MPGIIASTVWKAIALAWLKPSAQRSRATLSRISGPTFARLKVTTAVSPSSP